jgi:hypothetical protein
MTHSMSQRFAPLHSAFWHRIPAGVAWLRYWAK